MPEPDPRFDAFARLERGVPLSFQIAQGRLNRKPVCLVCFVCDAKLAEWPRDKIERAIDIACKNNFVPFDLKHFRRSLVNWWVQCGRLDPPQCWSEMKKRFIDAIEKKEREKRRIYGTDN
jgi:hypothetical protein